MPVNRTISTVLSVGLLSGASPAGSPFSKFCGKLDDRGRQACCYVVNGTAFECRDETISKNDEMRRIQTELLRRAEEARRKAEHPD